MVRRECRRGKDDPRAGDTSSIPWRTRSAPRGALRCDAAVWFPDAEQRRTHRVSGKEDARIDAVPPGRREDPEQATMEGASTPGADRFSFLAEVTRRLAESPDYEATLATVAEMSLPYLGAWCVVDLVTDDPDGNDIRRIAVLHPDPSKEEAARELHRAYPPRADDLIGAPRVMRSRRSERVVDMPDEALAATARDERHLELLRTLGVESYVIAPMVAHGRMFGAITFVTAESGRHFGEIDMLMAEDIARRAALTIESARVYREAVQAREASEAARAESAASIARLQALSVALSMASTQQEVAQAIVAQATTVLAAVDIIIARLTPDEEQLEIMSVGELPDDIRAAWGHFPVGAPVPVAEVTRTGTPIFLESRQTWEHRYPSIAPLLDATGHHANAVVPLIVERRVLGAMGVAFDTPRSFTEDDRALTLAVAHQCAQALERARLFEAERAARAEAETARAVAEQASRSKGEFLAAMSHELRTPLNAIAGYTQLLEMGLHGPITDEQRHVLERIDLAQRHLLRLVNEVLDFERLQSGRLEYHVHGVNLAEVVSHVEPMIVPQLKAKGVAYNAAIPAECRVRCDPEKLGQVLINLLSNAMKFTPAGGSVLVDCARRADGTSDRDMVYVRVTDTGVGIPREKSEVIFEPFVQVNATPSGRVAGAGLGLAISRHLVREMGGNLRVRSSPGSGTSFTVALPRAEHD